MFTSIFDLLKPCIVTYWSNHLKEYSYKHTFCVDWYHLNRMAPTIKYVHIKLVITSVIYQTVAMRKRRPLASVSPHLCYIIWKYNIKSEATHCAVAAANGNSYTYVLNEWFLSILLRVCNIWNCHDGDKPISHHHANDSFRLIYVMKFLYHH